MNNFQGKKRERFLNEEAYKQFVEGFEFGIQENKDLLVELAEVMEVSDPRHVSWRWGIASNMLQLTIGAYSAGDPVELLAPIFQPMLCAMEESVLPQSYRTEPFYLAELDTYAYAMWLLSLCKLMRLDALVPRVVGLFDVEREENRGQDELFEALVGKLGQPAEEVKGCFKHLKAHPLLLEAIKAEPSQRPKLMTKFLDKWYPAMKNCYWHGRHTKVPQNFFGYWAFEAGLVSYLWEIDDSSYRDMPFYPKDLVDYARTHGPADIQKVTPTTNTPPRTPAGEPCPKEGYWFTPANSDSRRYFKQGEVMPDFKNPLWATLWQWDENQKGPEVG